MRTIVYLIAILIVGALTCAGAYGCWMREFHAAAFIIAFIGVVFIGGFLAIYDRDESNKVTLEHHKLMTIQDQNAATWSPAQFTQVLADRKERDND